MEHSDSIITEVPHYMRKTNIEKYIREKSEGTRMTWTILRPVAFKEDFDLGFAGKILPTPWKVGLSPTTKLQLIATADIGYFDAQGSLRPKEFSRRVISLASNELTFDETNAIFRAEVAQNLPTTFGFIGSGLLWAGKAVGTMLKFFEQVGCGADISVHCGRSTLVTQSQEIGYKPAFLHRSNNFVPTDFPKEVLFYSARTFSHSKPS